MLKHLQDRKAAHGEQTLGAKGFTLIELLVVIVILGILAAVVVFSVRGINNNSQESACKTEARTVRTAQEAYRASPNNTGYSPNGAGLVAAGFLSQTPELVTDTSSTTQINLAWAGKCTSTSNLPATP